MTLFYSRRVFVVTFPFSSVQSVISLCNDSNVHSCLQNRSWVVSKLAVTFRLISCFEHLHSLYMCSENNCKPILWKQAALLWRSCGICVFTCQSCFINLLKQHQRSWHLKAIYSDELNKQFCNRNPVSITTTSCKGCYRSSQHLHVGAVRSLDRGP